MNKAVVLKNISKSYDKVVAVQNISFDVNESELFGLIGPDGAGKSTLMRMIVTLLLPTEGSARILGKDVVANFKYLRSHIGYMPGRFSLYTDLTVEENLQFYATVFGSTIEENYDLIKDVYSHIEPFKKRKAGDLSGGMKQKLALSCALIHRPKLLVLDEPTTGVDAVSRKEFWDMLKGLKSKGITIIVSTPYMDEAEMCDRIALMNKGTIMELDTPNAVKANYPGFLYKIEAPNLYEVKNQLNAAFGENQAYLAGQCIHLNPGAEIYHEGICNLLKSMGMKFNSCEIIAPNIEDCFINKLATIKEAIDE